MAFMILKLCLQHMFPEATDVNDLFFGDYMGRGQIQDVIPSSSSR